MNDDKVFILDADTLISAKNRYYAFSICPGFWDAIIRSHNRNLLFSIYPVRQELVTGRKDDDLRIWVENQLPKRFFLDVDAVDVMARYAAIVHWAQNNTQYDSAATSKFAGGADGWLVAYAAAHHAIVVTNETPAPFAKRDIKLPDVCTQFQVPVCNTFDMLRSLGVTFSLV